MLFDTHAHYDDKAFDADRAELLASMPSRGVGLILNAGCDMASSRESAALAETYDFVCAAAGVHPHEAKDMQDGDLAELAALLSRPKVCALGEIGLDYHYDFSPRDVQKRRFADQLALAQSLGAPVIIHEREAFSDTLDIIKRFSGLRGVFHCYGGSAESARELLKMGFYFSFNGVITFQNARRAPEVIRSLPENRILIETDCPYLTPAPYRGRRNDSGYIHLVAEKLALIRGIPPNAPPK